MAIDIRNFVNVNIDREIKVTLEGSRPIVTLFGATKAATLIGSNSDYTAFYDENYNTITGLSTTDLSYAKKFFSNKGSILQLRTDAFSKETVASLDDTHVILASEAAVSDTSVLETLNGIHQKIFVNRITDPISEDATGSDFIASKLSTEVGDEMSIAAYLSQIDVYTQSSPVDYAFTKEYNVQDNSSFSKLSESSNLVKLKYNLDITINDTLYNIGGNTTSGNDLVEQLGIIIMQQDLTTAIFQTLSSKISGQKGIAAIRTAMSEVLNNFVSSGFLIQNQIWTANDLVLPNKADSGKTKETVITKNTPLTSGYYIHMFKISSDLRKVYAAIIVATNKGIRYVQVDGKAI